MPKREWYEIHVHFTDNRAQILRRRDFKELSFKGLELDAIQAVRGLAKTLDSHLTEGGV